MHLKYETGIATMIQLIALSVLNIANMIQSIVVTCTHQGADCVGNALTSVIFYILIVCWFGIIAFLGYLTQSKRSKNYAKLLIAAEAAVILVAAYNIKLGLTYHTSALSLFTSLIDLILSFWVITLAIRLMRAGGGRVVRKRHTGLYHDE